MTLLWTEGFDAFGTATGAEPAPDGIIPRKWASGSSENYTDIENGYKRDYCWEPGGARSLYTPTGLTTNKTLIVGFQYSPWSIDRPQEGVSFNLITLREGTTESLILKQVGPSLEVWRGSTHLDSYLRLMMRGEKWFWLEFKATCDNTSGSYEVRLNGLTIMSDTGVDTQGGSQGYWDNVRFGNFKSNEKIDHLYICDGSGSDNNDFLGNVTVHTIRPDGDNTNNFATTTNASHYQAVDEDQVDDDTTYVEDSSSGATEIYTYEPTVNFTTVHGLTVHSQVNSGNASVTFQTVVDSSGSTTTQNSTINTSDYTNEMFIVEQDPNTSSAWTASTINSVKAGIKLP